LARNVPPAITCGRKEIARSLSISFQSLFPAPMLRVFGKRELAQLNPFDLVALLTLSNTVRKAIIGDDSSVTGGLIGAVALMGATSTRPLHLQAPHARPVDLGRSGLR
jgi:hypothetical protein